MISSKAIHAFSARRGFALVVTLSLMILLTVIAVGLLTLSSISLRASTQGEAGAVARANARLALMMAIGELQKEMGPDSRISAPHDAGTTATGGQPRWTAVYDAWQRPTDPTTPETPSTRTLKFRGWLASGANQAPGGPAGGGQLALLVGPGSLGTNPKPGDEVRVPMQAINSQNKIGHIAWWISDESTKAKVNAGPDASPTSTPLFDAQSPPHVGHQAFPDLKELVWKPGQRSMAVSNASVNLAANLGNDGVGNVNHDITVHSAGVLSDVRAGRLKSDLTNLLSRPITELENKPLYLADGRMNRFDIKEDGKITNAANITANATGAKRWGINLEELHLFHEIHREVDWSGGKPRLVSKNSQAQILNDRFFMYRTPTLEAVSLILAFIASPEGGTTPATYRIDATMDVIVSLSNPNDIPTVWPASVPFRTETEGFPYTPKWNIRRPPSNTLVHGHTVQAINSGLFKSSILGGFTLEAGEAAVFGASVTDTSSQSVNLTRGYAPRGGLSIDDKRWDSNNSWNPATDGLRATGLRPTDKMDFTMVPIGANLGNTPSGWISNYAKIGSLGVKIRTLEFGGGGNSSMTAAPCDTYMPSSIKPQGTSMPAIQDFIGKPLPVLMVTTMSNVERSRTSLLPPNALTSRPFLIHEPATSKMVSITNSASNLLLTMQNSQLLTIAESMDYKFGNDRTIADSTGQNAYHGGAREPGLLGGNKQVVKRRIPLAPPLSIGAFENAIACGFNSRFTGSSALNGNTNDVSVKDQNADPNIDPNNLPTLPKAKMGGPNSGWEPRASMVTMAKSIGNSWTNPFLKSDVIEDGTYHDQSWMANTALWDSWFLGGIVKPGPSGAWSSDSRSQKQQFLDLAARTANLRNTRLTYHPYKSATEALAELFNGDNLKPEAINKLTKYLLVGGAFNVNSTSETAWKAFLTSVRDQELLDANGTASKKTHPFGTLGYAVKAATSGPEGDWAGFRDLSDSELEGIAKAIVTEVKARGPFLSLADFVNRRPNGFDATQKAVGALQAAIDKSGINNRFSTTGRTLEATDVQSLPGIDTQNKDTPPVRAIGAAGFLSQGALLTAFGSQITVRGDTFLIRTYGDSRDAAGKLQAKAWCEAVVQRTPEFVDPTNPPEASASLSAVNTAFGRKINIVSFRWLSSNEI